MPHKQMAQELRAALEQLNTIDIRGLMNMHGMTVAMVKISQVADELDREEPEDK